MYGHGGDLLSAAERYGLSPDSFIDFSASINPLGVPPRVTSALCQAVPSLVHYPDPASRKPREALAAFLGVDAACLMLGNGAAEIIYLLTRVFRPKRALVAAPSFSLYSKALSLAGAEVRAIPLVPDDGFRLTAEMVWQEADGSGAGAGAIFLANPNNPTGRAIELPELDLIVALAEEKGLLLVMDEAFLTFLPDWRERSLVYKASLSPNVVVLGSLTKFFALPGLRVGYAVAIPETVERLQAARDPWSVNTLAQVAVAEAVRDEEYIRETRELIQRERVFLYGSLRRIPSLKPYPSDANFLLVETGDAPALRDALGRRGILIRDCSNFNGLTPGFFRVAVRGRDDNICLLNALQECLCKV